MAIYSLKGSTAANLSHLLQEKEKIITSLQKTLEEREKEKQTNQEELTELRRSVIGSHISLCCPMHLSDSVALLSRNEAPSCETLSALMICIDSVAG